MSDAYLIPEGSTKADFPSLEPEPGNEGPMSRQTAALLARRAGGTFRTQDVYKEPTPPPTIESDKEYALLQPGAEFFDPEGKKRKKPWSVTDDKSYENVPEGEQFLDPEGKLRLKPKYEPVDFTTQTLYGMAVNDTEREKILARAYGKENVKRGDRGLYAEKDGKRYRPGAGGFDATAYPFLAREAAPTIGSVIGGVGGGIGGSLIPGAGTTAGAIGGAAAGGAVGQAFNDLILGIAGVYDRSVSEEAGNLALAGLAGGVGEGAGRAVMAVAPMVKGAIQRADEAAPAAIAKMLGATEDPLATQTAAALSKEGVLVPPSAWMKEAPYLHRATEIFDPAFRTQKVLQKSSSDYYERKAGELLADMGIKREGAVVSPGAKASSEAAGIGVINKARENLMREDEILSDALAFAKDRLRASAGQASQANTEWLNNLRRASENSRQAAQNAINAGFDVIDTDVRAAMRAAGANENSGDLWAMVAERLRGENTAIKQRASVMYNNAREVGADVVPDSSGLPVLAREFLDRLPENFRSKHPDIVRRIEAWAGREAETDAAGQVIREAVEPTTPTFAELHQVRSLLRSDVDYHDLTPSIRDGAYKYFAARVNEVIQNAGDNPAHQAAAQLLNQADAFYAQNMAVFRDKAVQAVVNGIKSGEPADPQALASVLLKEGRTDLIREVERLVGPNLWSAVRAADLREMLDNSKSLIPGQIDGKRFISEVLSRDRSNLLEAVHGREMAGRVRKQAQDIARLNGNLDIPVSPGDNVSTLVERARLAAQAEKEAARTDPLRTLERDTKRLEQEFARNRSAIGKQRAAEPLGFLYDAKIGAVDAAERILGSQDLIFAAASKFGPNSPEFQTLRQVYVQRLFEGTMQPGDRLAKMTPELQEIMFPGASLESARTIAKNMDFLMNTKAASEGAAGASISAQSQIENPWGKISGLGKLVRPVKAVPGMSYAGRFLLTKYYQMLTWGATNPAFVQWVAKGLNGSPERREVVREAVQRAIGGIGGGLGQFTYQGTRE